MLILIALIWTPKALKRSFYRTRWLLIAMIVIFSWSTPGIYTFSAWYAPTIEGIYAGGEQALRLMAVIASLQIALRGMDQVALLSACYYLIYPFQWIGINTTAFAIRLGLTLEYAKAWLEDKEKLSWQKLGMLLDEIDKGCYIQKGEVEMIALSLMDRWVGIGLLGLFVLMIVGMRVLSL